MVEQWNTKYPSFGYPDIAALCDRLAARDETWLLPDQKRQLCILDTQLLALLEELQLDTCTVEEVAELFKSSLLHIQLIASAVLEPYFSYDDAISLIVQRINHVLNICDTPAKRRRYYKMGISIADCIFIEEHRQELTDFLERAREYMYWTSEDRASYIVQLCERFLMQLEDVRQSDTAGSSQTAEILDTGFWPHVLKLWLLGLVPEQIIEELDAQLPLKWQDAMKISTLIDNLCEFRLPWGLNAISMYLSPSDDNVSEENDFEIPEVVTYFASNLRFGVHCPVASVMLASGLGSRQAALSLSQFYYDNIEPVSIFAWLNSVSEETIYECTQDSDLRDRLIRFIESVQKSQAQFTEPRIPDVIEVELRNASVISPPMLKDLLTHIEEDERHIHLFGQEGLRYLGMVENPLLVDILRKHDLSLILKDIRYDGDVTRLILSVLDPKS